MLADWGPNNENMSLHLAARTGSGDAVERWLQTGSNNEASQKEISVYTPLHLAAWNMHTDVAIKLAKNNCTYYLCSSFR